MKQCKKCKIHKPIADFSLSLGKPRSKCKVCCNMYSAEYRQANPGYFTTWRTENADKQRAAVGAWLTIPENATRKRISEANWRDDPENKTKRRIYFAAWRATPEGVAKNRAKEANRRARKLNARGSHTAAEFKALCVEYDYRCAYCFIKCEFPTRDHIIALNRGGANDIANILPACLSCNCSKNDKLLWSWLDIRPDLEKRLSIEAYEYYHY